MGLTDLEFGDLPEVPGVDPYAGKTDDQVLAMAQAAYRLAEGFPARSSLRAAEWDTFDSAMAELMRRAMLHVLRRIREMEEAGEDNIPDPTEATVILELIERNGSGMGGDLQPGKP